MSKTTSERIESIYFGSDACHECDTEPDIYGQVAGFVGRGRGGLDFERPMHRNSGPILK
jgi:hypothetical protein